MITQSIEQEIKRILATETSAIAFSEKIFSHEGLFAKLAQTYDERKRLVQSPLYQEAQKRFRELQRREISAFRRRTDELRSADPERKTVGKSEPTKSG
jgi:hypothetical protein